MFICIHGYVRSICILTWHLYECLRVFMYTKESRFVYSNGSVLQESDPDHCFDDETSFLSKALYAFFLVNSFICLKRDFKTFSTDEFRLFQYRHLNFDNI